MSTHRDPEQLSAYIDGELTGADRDDLEQHLTGCQDCSATVRALRATVADMRALPAPVLSEQDSWALRSAIAKARRKPAERYRRWVIATGTAAAVAAAVVGVFALSSQPTRKSSARGGNELTSAPVFAGPTVAASLIQSDPTNYNSATARQLLASAPRIVAALPAPALAPAGSPQYGTEGDTFKSLSPADQSAYRPEIATCQSEVFSKGSGGAHAIAYIVGRYENTPVFFLIYSVAVSGSTKTEMWVVQRSNCYIRLFLAPQ